MNSTEIKNNTTSKKRRPLVLHARMMNGTGGGPDKTILNSPRFLKQLGFECICVFYRPADDEGFSIIRERAKQAATDLVEINDGGLFDFSMIRKTIKLCRERKVDIWHGHDYKTNLLGWIVSKFHKMKLITTAHGWVDYSGRLPTYYGYEKRWVLPRYETVICVSSTVMDEAIAGGTPKSKCVLIENAIDSQQFSRQRSINQAKSEDFDLDDETLLVGSIGRLSEEKGFRFLIDAVAKLIDEGMNLKLVIAGDGPQKKHLQEQINQLGHNNRIRLLGFCSDTRAFYESLDIFVLSSLREGLPNVVLEAMSVGAPIIATKVDGVPRIITDDHDGFLIEPGSCETITAAIRKLQKDPSLRNDLANQARNTIERKWSFARRMRQIADIYQVLLTKR